MGFKSIFVGTAANSTYLFVLYSRSGRILACRRFSWTTAE